MTFTDSRYERGLKPAKRGFWIAAILFVALSTTVAVQERSRRVLEKTHGELTRAKEGLARVKGACLSRRQALTSLKSQFVQNNETTSPERLIYGKIDEIKARLKPDDMTIAALEKKEGDVSLQFTLKFINPNYCELLNSVNQLQQAVFPFTPVNSIAVTQAEQNGKGVVEFTIIGSVLTPERNKP